MTGAGGQLGRALIAQAPAAVQVLAATSHELDIADGDTVRRYVRREAPALVLNAAAYTAVDRAESDAERAGAVNDAGVAHLVAAVEAVGARVAHVSTCLLYTSPSPRD